MKLRPLFLFFTLSGLALPSWAAPAQADEPVTATTEKPIVVQYDAPTECPGADAFAASVRAELAGRRWNREQPVPVHVVVSAGDGGYTATVTSTNDAGAPLERTLTAPSCDEVTDIAAAIIAMAQAERPADVTVTTPAPPPSGPSQGPPPAAPPASRPSDFTFSFSLGYGAFTEGPATPVVNGNGERTTFNPAQGVRLGFGVTHAIGWWKHSLYVGAAYYRQSTNTVASTPLVSGELVTSAPGVSLDDRDVLLGTLDACPLQFDYAFMSFIPCATFTMMQSRGNSGNDPGLETGLGGTARVRGTFGWFFGEALGTAAAVSSSYEPPSRSVRFNYALSLGVQFR